jgi:hypothetical protein
MTQQYGAQAFDEAQKLFRKGFAPEAIQALAERTITNSKEFYDKAAAVALDNSKVLNELAETAWGSTKLLNEKVVQNMAANIEAAFAAAKDVATAKSLPEIGKIQTDYVTKLAAQASEQTKEFADLSTRAAQHLFEKAQAAAKSFKPLV